MPFEVHSLTCSKSSGWIKLIRVIEEEEVVKRILKTRDYGN
jgi:hypothetical protein